MEKSFQETIAFYIAGIQPSQNNTQYSLFRVYYIVFFNIVKMIIVYTQKKLRSTKLITDFKNMQ